MQWLVLVVMDMKRGGVPGRSLCVVVDIGWAETGE